MIQNLTQQLDQFSGGPKAGDSFPKTFITNTLKPTSSNRTKAAKNLAGLGVNVISCTSPEQAIEGAQIITTCTADKQYATILTDNMVGSGVHINAIGGDCPGKTELHKDILLRAKVFVEYPEQTRIEGEIQQMPADFAVTELWQVIAGQTAGRVDPREITLFDSVGFAIEDFAALRYVHEQIKKAPFYVDLDMMSSWLFYVKVTDRVTNM